jgi:hypothetical protein
MKTFRRPLVSLGLPTGLFLSLVSIAHAQSTSGGSLGTFILKIIAFINTLVVPLVFALAFIIFIIGVFRYFIAGAANEEKRQEGQKFVMYGLIGFVLMLSVWGLVNLLVGTLGFGGQNQPPLPTFNVPGSSGSPSASDPFGTASHTNGNCTSDSDCRSGETCSFISGTGVCSGVLNGGGTTPSPSPSPEPPPDLNGLY